MLSGITAGINICMHIRRGEGIKSAAAGAACNYRGVRSGDKSAAFQYDIAPTSQ